LGLDPDISQLVPGNQTVSYWDVANITSAIDQLVALKGTLIQEKTNVGGPIFVAIVQDPFGNHIGLIEGA
jgi:predicted enzyme related to lactoylglutathione lyase